MANLVRLNWKRTCGSRGSVLGCASAVALSVGSPPLPKPQKTPKATDFPPRDPAATANEIDLAPYFNRQLDKPFFVMNFSEGLYKSLKPESGNLSGAWKDWVIAHALLREAEKSIAGQSDQETEAENI